MGTPLNYTEIFGGGMPPVANSAIKPTATPSLDETHRAQLLAVFEASRDGFVAFDPQGNLVLANDNFVRLCGYSSKLEMQRSLEYFTTCFELRDLDGNLLPVAQWPACRVIRGEAFEDLILHVRRTDNDREWYFNYSGRPARDENGNLTLAVLSMRDVTDERRLIATLELQNSRLEALIEQAPAGIVWAEAPSGRLLGANSQLAEIFRHPFFRAGAVSEYDNYRGFHLDGRPYEPHEWPLARAITKGEVVKGEELNILRGDGTMGSIRLDARPIRDAAEKIIGGVVIVTDITERDHAQEALRESEAKFRALTEATSEAVWTTDASGTIVETPTWSAYSGQKPEEANNFGWVNALHPEDQARTLAHWRSCIKSGVPYEIEYRVRHARSGEWRWSVARAVPLRNSKNEVTGWVGMNCDINDRKQVESALQESEERFRTLANSIPQLAWVSDPDGQIQWFNERWYEHTGTVLDEAKGWGWQKVVHPDHEKRVSAFVKTAWKDTKPWEITFPLRNREGQYRWFLTRAVPLLDASGKVKTWFGTNTDINDQIETQDRLKAREAEMESLSAFLTNLMNSVPHMVWVADEKGAGILNNIKHSEYTGYSDEEIRGEGWIKVIHPDDLERCFKLWQEAVTAKQVFTFEVRIRRKDGEYRWHLVRALPYPNPNGETIWFGTNTDIHDSKMKSEELRQSNAELARFAFVASHDLKEPLRTVSNFSQLLAARYRGKLDPTADMYIGFMTEAVIRMYELIEDLLRYSRLGASPITLRKVPMESVVTTATQNLCQAIEESGAKITWSELPTVSADFNQLVQLFQNLISNAIKYRRADVIPEITIDCKERESEWLFSVKDTGIGIEPQYYEKIFILFQRLHRKEEYSGSGIGLAVCKRVVETHGGRIWVESVFGAGTTFYFTLPK